VDTFFPRVFCGGEPAASYVKRYCILYNMNVDCGLFVSLVSFLHQRTPLMLRSKTSKRHFSLLDCSVTAQFSSSHE
jgi:hypothetical protein